MVVGQPQMKVFISYSHQDVKYLRELQDHLEPIIRAGSIDIWDDTRLQGGQYWRDEIRQSLAEAQVAICLVSAHFLASSFIIDNELPELLLGAMSNGVVILPVVVGYCDFSASQLGNIQAVNDPAKPLGAMRPQERGKIWVRLVRRLNSLKDGAGDVTLRSSHPEAEAAPSQLFAQVSAQASNEPGSAKYEHIPEDHATKSQSTTEDEEDEGNFGQLSYAEYVEKARRLLDKFEFFRDRLAEAFPGIRGLRTWTGPDALARLTRFLEPLAMDPNQHREDLWWWRGTANMYIDRFAVLNEEELRCLIGNDEILVGSVAVYRNPNRDYRSFVYVAARADKSTGVRQITEQTISRMKRQFGYAREDVGHWEGRYVTPEELDDGFAEIEGRSVRIVGAEGRSRYLTPYNLFISSQMSVLNNLRQDKELAELCGRLLSSKADLNDAVHYVQNASLSERMREYYEEFYLN